MTSEILRDAYQRAERERPSLEIISSKRLEPTLEEARDELAKSLSRVIDSFIQDKYGFLGSALSELTLVEIMKSFEINLARAKGDITIVAQELFDRVATRQSK